MNDTIHQTVISKNFQDFNNRKLLVISHAYRSFQKDSVEIISDYFQEIDILVRTNPFAEISNYFSIPQLERYNIYNKIDMSCNPSNINVISTPIWYLPLNKTYKSLGERHFKAVEKAIKNHHMTFDLIHAHITWSAGFVGARLKEKYHVPFVVTAHGYDIYSLPFKDNEWRKKVEYVLNTANHIFTVSQRNLSYIKKLDVTTPVTVIPNGFKRDLFYPRERIECRRILNLPLDKKIILTVGNLDPIKGQKYLIEAINEIIQENETVLCVIIGLGELRSFLEGQIRSYGLENKIMLAGGKSHDEIPLWINACDIFVLPSLNEGNPTVMFEVLGCGRPFLGSKVGGIPEVIISDEYGLLFEPSSVKDLKEKIRIALNRDWDTEKIRSYAEQYSWDIVAKEILKVYKEVLH